MQNDNKRTENVNISKQNIIQDRLYCVIRYCWKEQTQNTQSNKRTRFKMFVTQTQLHHRKHIRAEYKQENIETRNSSIKTRKDGRKMEARRKH